MKILSTSVTRTRLVCTAIALVFAFTAACSSSATDVADAIGDDNAAASGEATEPIERNEAVQVSGAALDPFNAEVADPAVGNPAPQFVTVDPAGNEVATTAGTPTILAFLVHWCPHCQAELPEIEKWAAEGNLPAGVELIAVSTGFDPGRGNWPPSSWFADEGWSHPLAVDSSAASIAGAYGMTSFPYLVAVDADGNVAGRGVGGGAAQLDALAALAQS